ncbi:unnamed protein product, partial [marine sediment metagenome]
VTLVYSYIKTLLMPLYKNLLEKEILGGGFFAVFSTN